jgi:NET1-associated nuclear protein 1 (U3 small nucleolar RNA-associated protein 17)
LSSPTVRFLFLATSRGVQVYSASESLLVRTLPVQKTVAYTLSASKPNFLYVATSSGDIFLFDWTTGKKIRQSSGLQAICAIAVAQLPWTKHDALFAIENEESDGVIKDHITIRNITSSSVSLFWVPVQTLRHLKVLDNGRTIFAASETQLVIGTLNGVALDASIELSELPSRYVWRTLNATEVVTCLDAQVRSQPSSGTSKKQRLIFDLVLGNVKGEVIVYEDILFKLEENEKLKGKDTFLKPIIYHWHREAPSTVKWSLDGKKQTFRFQRV